MTKQTLSRTLIHVAVVQALALAALPGLYPGSALASSAAPVDAAPMAAETAVQQPQDIRREQIELKNAVLAQPEDPELRWRLGLAYLRDGDGAASEKELRRAIRLGREGFEVRLKLGEAWLMQGNFDQVLNAQDLDAAETPADRAAVAVLRGYAQLAQGKAKDALPQFEQAVELAPAAAPGQIGLTETNLTLGDLGAAEVALALVGQATDPAAGPGELARLRGDLALARGRVEEAQAAYLEAAQARPDDRAVLRGLARTRIQLNKLNDAKAGLDHWLALKPQDGDALYLRAVVAYQQQDFERAMALASPLASIVGASPEPLFIAGAAAYFLGQPQQAREYLSRYVPQRPDHVAGRLLLGDILLRDGDPKQAFDVLRPIKDQVGDNAEALALLGTAAAMSGAVAEGAGYLEQAAALNPDDTGLAARLAAVQMAGGNRQQGIAELERLAAGQSGLAGADLVLARDYLAHGELDAAVAAAARLGQQQPEAAEAPTLRGLARLQAGDLDAAQAAFEAALKLRPDDIDARTGLAEVQLRRGETEAALAAFAAIAEAHPDPVLGQLNLAAAERRAGRGLQAEQRLQRTLAEHPDSLGARIALANSYTADARPDEALDLLREAPDQDSVAVLLATARAELVADRPADAVQLLEKATALDPASVPVRLALADAYEHNDQQAVALGTLDQLLAQAPNSPEVRYARLRLLLTKPRMPDAELREALSDVEAFIAAYPTDVAAAVLRGQALMRVKGQQEAALSILGQVNDAANSADSAVRLADALVLGGRVDEAVAVLGRYCEAHPGDNYARLRLGRIRLTAGDYAKGADDLLEGIKRGARRDGLVPLTAWALAVGGRADEARAYLQPDEVDGETGRLVEYTRGLLALAGGDARQAVSLLQGVIDAQGGAASPRLRLDYARALEASGQRQPAFEQVQQALAAQPIGGDRAAAEALLQQLQ